jgi:hypothetical protein
MGSPFAPTNCSENSRGLSVAPRARSFRRGDVDYVVFCFGELAHANLFRTRFKGERVQALK